ncbi:MAG: BREX system P-loop protein BrxC [Actinomycetota bacterium]|nr:BREX system P-loop protein BrxC [Actinomycetota bacterium]
MRIAEIFRHDLDREIKEVIKVDASDVDEVSDELREYVVTDHIHDAFVELLDHYQDSINRPSEAVNAWISGFFGSGKSSFAKVLGYILANPKLAGTTAADLFTAKLATQQIKALLNTIHSRAPTMAIFVDLSASRNVAREGEAVVLPLYRELLTQLDYARNLELAELEITLEADGRLEAFIDAFGKATGLQWRDRRDKALALNEASKALHELDPETYPAADSYARTRPEVEVTNNWFAKRAMELLFRRRPDARRIAFVVDEVGQYVSRSVQRMLDLQGLAQAFQKEGGRLWLIATGQETLEDVVSALDDKRVELARVRDRFPLNVDLVPSDIEEVVSKRVLEKNEIGAQAVRSVYDQHQNQLRANVTLDSPTRGGEFTREEFTRVYPLLPYQVQLFIDAVSGLRAHGGAGPMVGGANRTLIRLAHQLLRTVLANLSVGALTTVPMAYDLMDEIVPTSWRAEIDQVMTRHGSDSTATEVVKTIALTSNVRALKLDAHNLAVLIHPAASAETRQPEVVAALQKLVAEETVREGEDGYRLQSPQEKDWEKARRSRELKTGDFNRLLRETHLRDMLQGLTAAAGSGYKRQFKVGVLYDDDKLLDGDITLRIYEGGDDQLQRAVQRSRESAHANEVFLVFSRSENTWRYAEEVFRSQEIIKDAQARSLESAETELLHEERKRYERHVRQFQRSLADDVLKGGIVFRGNASALDGRDLRSALNDALQGHLAEIYTRLDEFTAPVKKGDAVSLIRTDDLSGLPDYLGPDGLGVIKIEADGHKIDETGPVAQLMAVVRERMEYGSEATGKYIESHFQRPPFGAELDVVMVVAAAAVRAGLVTVGQGGSWLRSRTDARLEQVFSAVPKFRAAVLRTREELDVKVRTRVAKLLHEELVGERPGLATEDLAAFAREQLELDREKVDSVFDTLIGLALGTPEPVDRVRQILRRMRSEDDETLVRSLDAGRADLKDGILAARDLHELLGDKDRLETLRAAREVLERDTTSLTVAGRRALDLAREILRTRTFGGRFPELRGAVETLRAEHESAWEEARDDLDSMIAEIRERSAPLLDLLTDAQRAEFSERLEAVAVSPDANAAHGPSVETIRARAERLPTLLDDLRAEIGRTEGKSVRRVSIRDLFNEPVRDEDDLEALLKRIREAAEEALKDDEYFLLT